jgi:hypothetical protein
MPRVVVFLIVAAGLAGVVFAPAVGAAPKTCTTKSPDVAGETIEATLKSSNVNDVQAGFATCRHAKKVIAKVTSLGLEEPMSVRGFYCRPTVVRTSPEDVVSYVCTFKGADTAMFVKLTFKVKYVLE